MRSFRIPPSERIHKEIREIVEGMTSGNKKFEGNPIEGLMEKAKLLIVEQLLEKEVEEFLRRPYYQRKKQGEENQGYRNGYEPRKLKTAEGILPLEVPQVRDSQEPFRSRIQQFFQSNTDVLEKLSTEMYARGLSTRDIEEALYAATGDRLLSKSSVPRVTEILWQEYEWFITRDLSLFDLVYLVVDAVYETIRPYIQTNEAILVAYGVTTDGRKVLLHMDLGNKESYDFCREFFRNMVKRGLKVPLSMTSDGAPGLIKAIEEIFPQSLRIRCWVHRMRNLAAKLPPELWERIKPEVTAIRDSLTYHEGKERLENLVQKYQQEFPSFIRCLADDQEALLHVLKLPYRHRKTIRSTNLVERMFLEERRRTSVIPQFLTEKSCLKLVFSVLYRASYRWRRIAMSEKEQKQIEQLRAQLNQKKESFSSNKKGLEMEAVKV